MAKDKTKEIKQEIFENTEDCIVKEHIGKTIEKNQKEYSNLVITGRAIPSLYDGLKPVVKRLLYTFKLENYINKNIKSARVVGSCIGKLHPHGDLANYGALVEMTQVFKNKFPLTRGQGNWGSIQGDSEAASRYCVTGDTYVNTNKGLEQIKEIVKSELNTTKKITRKVYSIDNEINNSNTFFNSGFHNIFKLKTKAGYKIRGSLNHPILTISKDFSGKPIYLWKMLSEIKKEDIILIDRNKKDKLYKNIKTKELDKERALIIACLVSGGSISNNRITFVNTDENYYNNFTKAWEKVFDDNYYSYSRKLKSGKIIYEFDIQKNNKNKEIFNSKIIKLLKNKKAKEKESTKFIMKHNLEIKKIYLSNLFEGDGWYRVMRKNKGISIGYDSKSLKLIEETQILLLDFGIYSNITKNKKSKNISYRLSIPSFENQLIFKNEVSFSSLKKESFEKEINSLKEHLENNLKYSHSGDYIPYISEYIKNIVQSKTLDKININRYEKIKRNYKKIEKEILKNKKGVDLLSLLNKFYNDNYYYTSVDTIEELEEKEIVYSIKVNSNCHSFVANGFVNHNTEVKLPSEIADMLFENIHKDGVTTWKPNYDDQIMEPEILPVKYPIALLNGTFGIAYAGITTKIPSYNIRDLTNLYIYLIDNKFWEDNFNVDEHKSNILEIIPSVDFATGTNIYFDDKKSTQEDMIFSSEFNFRMRANYEINEKENTIIFKNIPGDLLTDRLVEEIKDAGLSYRLDSQKKQIPKTSDFDKLNISDNADVEAISTYDDKDYKNDAEITIQFKQGSNLNIELAKVFKLTSLDSSYSARMRFIDKNECPILLSLYEHSIEFLKFRLHTFFKSFQYDINKLKEQLHLLYGLKTILNDLDKFINIIKNTDDTKLVNELMNEFKLDEIQIEHLINIQVRKLGKTSLDKLTNDIKEKEEKKSMLEDKISTKEKLYQVVKEDYENQLTKQYIKGKKGDRITKIIQASKNVEQVDLIESKDVILMYMEDDTIGYVEKENFKFKNRGTKTTNNKNNKDFDLNLKLTESCDLKDQVLLMTSKGRVFKKYVFEFSNSFKFIGNIINIDKEEEIISILKFDENQDFYNIVTKNGKIKGLNKKLIKNITSNRSIKIISLEEEDTVSSFTSFKNVENEMILFLTTIGRILKYPTNLIKILNGGNTKGVKAASLKENEKILKSFIFTETNETVIIGVSNDGKAKKTLTKNIIEKKRAQSPMVFFNNNDKNGKLIGGAIIENEEKEGLMILTEKANVSLVKIKNFNSVSKNTKGSINLVNIELEDKIKLIKKIEIENKEDE